MNPSLLEEKWNLIASTDIPLGSFPPALEFFNAYTPKCKPIFPEYNSNI